MSTWLRGIPARDSEYSAISGLDPISLAELGLQDAIKVAALDPTVAKAHLQQVLTTYIVNPSSPESLQ